MNTMQTRAIDQVYATQQVFQWLRSILRSQQPIALVGLTLNEFSVLHDFTTDPQVLIEALDGVSTDKQAERLNAPEPVFGAKLHPVTNGQVDEERQNIRDFREDVSKEIILAQAQFVNTKVEEYLRLLAHALSGIPGRKSVIWVASDPPKVRDESTWQLLVNAQVALYPVDARGLTNPGYDTLNNSWRTPLTVQGLESAMETNRNKIVGFHRTADWTGGRAFVNRNDLADSFQKAAGDTTAYYELGYYPEKRNRYPGWHKIAVKVNRKGLHVRARNGVFVPGGRDSRFSPAMQLALESPWNFTEIPLWVRSTPRERNEKNSKIKVGFEFRVDGSRIVIDEPDGNKINLEFLAVALDAHGNEVAKANGRVLKQLSGDQIQALQSSMGALDLGVELEPGDYTMRFVVRDAISGRIGSVAAPLRVEAISH
jgi:VWFA-related protein